MNLRTLLKALLTTALLAALALPAASAESHVACASVDWRVSACVQAGSESWGSCESGNGSEGTFVNAYTGVDGAYRQTSAGSSCYASSYEWENATWTHRSNGVYAYTFAWDGDDAQHAGVYWTQYEGSGPYGSYGGCSTNVHVAMDEDLGCPAGAPPAVPAILP